MVTIYWILTKSSIQWLLSKKKIKFPSFCVRWALINFDNMKGTKTVLTHEGLFEVKWTEGRMYKREDIIIVPIQTFPLSILAFSPLPPRHQVTSRDNHWWRHSLAHVVEDRVWYTLRGENFYYRKVWGNASPPPPKREVFVLWRCTTAPFTPLPFLVLMYHEGKCWRIKAPIFLRKVKTIIFLGNNLTKLHFWRKLLLAILLLSGPNRKCLSCWVIIIIFLS